MAEQSRLLVFVYVAAVVVAVIALLTGWMWRGQQLSDLEERVAELEDKPQTNTTRGQQLTNLEKRLSVLEANPPNNMSGGQQLADLKARVSQLESRAQSNSSSGSWVSDYELASLRTDYEGLFNKWGAQTVAAGNAANLARREAQAAQQCCDANSEKLNRMFEKTTSRADN